jgi:hypothetical protein
MDEICRTPQSCENLKQNLILVYMKKCEINNQKKIKFHWNHARKEQFSMLQSLYFQRRSVWNVELIIVM